MTTYPLTFPSVGIVQSSFSLTSTTASSVSPFTGEEQVYFFGGQFWEGSVTFKPSTRAEIAEVQSFLAKLKGRFGTFLYNDPDDISAVGGVGGTVTVNGASQTGNTLTVDGMTPSSTIRKAGDYFSLGTGLNSRLYMFTEDLVSDGAGEGTATFEPNLRSSPADNDTLDITNPTGLFRLADNTALWNSNRSSVYEVSISFREVI
jgi:hypothetical protein